MSSRSERLFAVLEEMGAQAFVSGKRPNQLYLLDHPDPSTVISRANCHAVLFAPGRTVVFPGVWISNACSDLLTNCEVVPNRLGDPPPDQQLVARLKQEGFGKVVFDQASAGLVEAMGREAPDTEVVVDDLATVLRRTKDEQDLARMRQTAGIADLGMLTAFAAIRPGVRCQEVIAEGVAAMLRAGAEDADMKPACGVGTYYLDSGEDPRRVIQEGDMVFIDMIIHVHGYLGDMTRAGIVGEGSPERRELLETVQGAYRLATGLMKRGSERRRSTRRWWTTTRRRSGLNTTCITSATGWAWGAMRRASGRARRMSCRRGTRCRASRACTFRA